MIAIVVAAFLFQPFRDWVQARLDHFFYRDRLDYRRTLIEFGRTLTNEVRLEPLLGSVLDRISQTLLVDRLAVFLEDAGAPGHVRTVALDGIALLPGNARSEFSRSRNAAARSLRGCLVLRIGARRRAERYRHRCATIEELDLNYFIPCRFRDHTVAVLGLGKTVDGDFLSSEDLELLSTIAGYVAIALENAQLYHSLEQKACRSSG